MIPIVIIHGWNSQLSRWQPVVDLFKKSKIKVYLPALPGFNQQPIPRTFSINDYVNWFKQYLIKNKISSCILIGHSLGGQIGIQFTALYPKQVNKLILVNSAGIRPKMTYKRIIFTPIAKLGKWFFELKPLKSFQPAFKELLYFFARESDYLKSSPIMKQTLIQVINEDQQAYMKKISQPTLIIWGQQDQMTPLKYGRKIHSLIPQSKLTIFPSARHGLPFTHVRALVKQILHFIKA